MSQFLEVRATTAIEGVPKEDILKNRKQHGRVRYMLFRVRRYIDRKDILRRMF